MERFNKIKDTKILSDKAEKPVINFWTSLIENYKLKILSSNKLLDSLSLKKQPKTKGVKKKGNKCHNLSRYK